MSSICKSSFRSKNSTTIQENTTEPQLVPKRICNYDRWEFAYFRHLINLRDIYIAHIINYRKNLIGPEYTYSDYFQSYDFFHVFCKNIYNSSSKNISIYLEELTEDEKDLYQDYILKRKNIV